MNSETDLADLRSDQRLVEAALLSGNCLASRRSLTEAECPRCPAACYITLSSMTASWSCE